ncbi:MAG TPA: ABC transporter substrate-binding protein [Aestuariivirga sp.]|jgi:ABC-type transporter MlaC component|nr:ABC transporter substrate-binding protein [Aestuariivirga sp.]
MMRGRWLVFLFILLLGACLPSATAKSCEASTFITNAGNAFLGAARRQSASAYSGVASRYTDLRGISMFALGPHRKLVSKANEAEYLALTRSFIGRFLAKYSNRFSGSGLAIKECAGSKNNLTVNTRLANGKKIIFKIYKSKRGYLVRDVNVSSVWLAQQLRSTFVGVIRRNGGDINALFKYLRT